MEPEASKATFVGGNQELMALVFSHLPAPGVANCALACRALYRTAQVRLSALHLDATVEPERSTVLATVSALTVRQALWGQQAAAVALVDVLPKVQRLQSLTVCIPALAEEHVGAVCAACAALTALTQLQLTHASMSSVGAQDVADQLSALQFLEALDLSSNQLGDAGVAFLSESIVALPRLSRLALAANLLGPLGIRTVVSAARCLPVLRALDLSHNCSWDPVGQSDVVAEVKSALLALTHLRDLRVGGVLDFSSWDLVEELRDMQELEALDISAPLFYPAAHEFEPALLRQIRALTALTSLSLAGRRVLEAPAAALLSAVLSDLSALRHLDLQSLSMEGAVFRSLAPAVAAHAGLTFLQLGLTPTADPWARILQACTELRFLCIQTSPAAPWQLLGGLQHLTELHVLFVATRAVGRPAEARHPIDGLVRLRSLRSCRFEVRHGSEPLLKHVLKALAFTNCVTSLALNSNLKMDPDWVDVGPQLARMNRLQFLQVKIDGENSEQAAGFATSLAELTALTQLCIWGRAQLSPRVSSLLALAFGNMRRLRVLEVRAFQQNPSSNARARPTAATGLRGAVSSMLMDDTELDARAVSRGLALAISRLHRLQALSLRHHWAAMASCLPHLSLLTRLDLSSAFATTVDTAALGTELASIPQLEDLNLSHTRLEGGLSEALADGLAGLSRLTHLALAGMGLARESAGQLARILPALTRLQVLSLAGNNFGQEGAAQVAAALAAATRLVQLHVSSAMHGFGAVPADEFEFLHEVLPQWFCIRTH